MQHFDGCITATKTDSGHERCQCWCHSAPEPNLYDRIAASAEGSPHAEPYKLSAPVDREHAAWCWLPADHQGMCEGDQ